MRGADSGVCRGRAEALKKQDGGLGSGDPMPAIRAAAEALGGTGVASAAARAGALQLLFLDPSGQSLRQGARRDVRGDGAYIAGFKGGFGKLRKNLIPIDAAPAAPSATAAGTTPAAPGPAAGADPDLRQQILTLLVQLVDLTLERADLLHTGTPKATHHRFGTAAQRRQGSGGSAARTNSTLFSCHV
jgi:hypothetical protein